MIWAIHFAYDNGGANSFEQIAQVIRQNNVNVIGLLESDLTRVYNDNLFWDWILNQKK